ncbi:hypothetical protein ZWY2020_026689 [Hordeum vulgare]|nr:hypothetical protein ZWY2020_026689 [Hordeum vulgare]
MKTHERAANLALAGLSLAPIVINVIPNLNVILTACLTVYVGCYRSVKSTPPAETMSKEHAMRFPLVGSAMLLSLFLLFKFLPRTCATLFSPSNAFLPEGWNDNAIVWHAPYFHSLSVEFTKSQVVASVPGFFLSRMAGLFVYDIFWVFFTPVMVSVAKSFDAPIKLLFPTADAARPFSMLGLGDIVIPGIFVALAFALMSREGLRIATSIVHFGVHCGMTATIVVMNWFQAAQPALLYIVPGVTGFVAVHSLWNGEVKPLLEFTETQPEEEGAAEEEEEDSSQSKKVD